MRLCCALIFALVLVTSQASPVNIAPVGKEYTYTIETDVQVGTKEPTDFNSRYMYKGKLILSGIKENLVQFALTDLTYTIQNGDVKSRDTPGSNSIPADASPLTIPFVVEYDSAGRMVSIRTDSKDIEWSINMKKSIAVNFEIGAVQTMPEGATFANIVEQTIYGKCDVTYQIVNKEAGELEIIKTMDPSACKNNLRLKEEKDVISTDNGKVYNLMEKDGKMMVKTIKAEGAVIAHPKGVRNENAFVLVRQFIDLVKEGASSASVPKEEGSLHTTYKYNDPVDKCRDVPLGTALDVTGGRRKTDTAALMKNVDQLLEKIVHYFDANHVTMMRPEMKNINLINQILFELETANLDVLEQIFVVLTEKSKTEIEDRKLNAYIELLPYIGTRPAAILIRNLVRKNKIDNLRVVERMLFNLPEQIRCPTEKLLAELKDFMNLETKDETLNDVAALSFAALVKYTFEDVSEKSIDLETYIAAFEQKYKAATEHRKKLLYLECLGNIQIGSVLKRTLTLLEDEKDTPLRIMMLRISIDRLYEDPSLMIRTVWPLITNLNINPRLRMMAIIVYTKVKNPTVNHFMNLYYLMRFERNELIYAFYYNTLKALSDPTDFYENTRVLSDVCKLIVRLSRKPMIKITAGVIIGEKVDEASGMGVRVEHIAIPDGNGKKSMAFTLNRKINSEIHEIVSLYSCDTDGPTWISVHRHERCGKIIRIRPDVEDFVEQMLSPITAAFNDDNKEGIMIPFSSETAIPNDMGAPIKLYDRMSIFLQMKVKIDTSGDIAFNVDVKFVQAMSLGMKSFNPIANLWHGVQELKTMAANIPVSGGLDFNRDGFRVYLNLGGTSNVIGAQFYGETQVFVENLMDKKDQELLGVGDVPDMFVKIGRDFVEPTNKLVFGEDLEELGKRLSVQIFECDREISWAKFDRVEVDQEQFLSQVLSLNLFRHKAPVWDAPGVQRCGVGYQLTSTTDIDRIELIGKYSVERKDDEFPVNKTYTAEFRSVSPKNETVLSRKFVFAKPTKSWSHIKEGMGIYGEFSTQANYKAQFYINVTMVPGDYGIRATLDLPEKEANNHFEYQIMAMRSDEQDKTKNIMSSQCKPEFMNPTQLSPLSRKCYLTETGLRSYIFNISSSGKQGKDEYSWELRFPLLQPGKYDYIRSDGYIAEGLTNLLDENHMHSFSPPVNTYFGMEAFDFVWERHSCIVRPGYIMRENMMTAWEMAPKDWTSYFKKTQKDNMYEVQVKMGSQEDTLAFRMIRPNETLECDALKEGFECKMNGVVLSDPKYTPITTQIKRMTTANPPMILLDTHGLMVVYDRRTVRLELKDSIKAKWDDDTTISGICMDTKDSFCFLDS